MGKLLQNGDWITRVRPCLQIDYEFSWGGDTHYLSIGEPVIVITKYGTKYFGLIHGYEAATQEGMQDCILLLNQDEEVKRVGIHDIVEMERPEWKDG